MTGTSATEMDRTMVHAYQPTTVQEYRMPPLGDAHWACANIDYFLQARTDQQVRQPSELARGDQTELGEEDRSNNESSPASRGVKASVSVFDGSLYHYRRPQMDQEAILILRAQYLAPVLTSLAKMQACAETPQVARYAGDMLEASTLYADRVPDDPVVEVILAVYPALADENHWADWSSEQFCALHKIIRDLAKRPSVTPEAVEKAILRIEEQVGLDTLPFEVDPREIS